jgi:hypothetical protein
MGMIAITLNDKIYQDLQKDLADLQVKQMIDGAFRFDEEQQIKDKIQARYNELKQLHN